MSYNLKETKTIEGDGNFFKIIIKIFREMRRYCNPETGGSIKKEHSERFEKE